MLIQLTLLVWSGRNFNTTMSMNVWKNKKNCFTHAGFITCSVSAVTQSICCYGRNVCHNSITQSHRCQLLLTRFDSGISVSAYKQGRILKGPQLLCWWGSHNCFASETSDAKTRRDHPTSSTHKIGPPPSYSIQRARPQFTIYHLWFAVQWWAVVPQKEIYFQVLSKSEEPTASINNLTV